MNKISKTEDKLFEAMEKIGLHPKRQYPISKMHVDFAFPKEKLVIEVNGGHHRTREEVERDEKRRDVCENLDWRVKVFTAEQVYENPEAIAWKIYNMLNYSKNSKLSDFPRQTYKYKLIKTKEEKDKEYNKIKKIKSHLSTAKRGLSLGYKYVKKSVIITIILILSLFILPLAFYVIVYVLYAVFIALSWIISIIFGFLFSSNSEVVFTKIISSFLGRLVDFLTELCPKIWHLIYKSNVKPILVIILIGISFIIGYFKIFNRRFWRHSPFNLIM
jgi:very-short-patch-repair endonuclease